MPIYPIDEGKQQTAVHGQNQYTGIVRYVSPNGDDTHSGLYADDPFETIAHAISESAAGDAIRVAYGTYDEAGLNLSLAGLSLWLEPGVILKDTANGDVLTISAFGCAVHGEGNIRIDPTGGATGVVVSGNFASIRNLRVNANSAGAIGYDITGDGTEMFDCRCSAPTTAAYKIQGDKTMLVDCCTGGDGTTIGYWVTNSCDKARLRSCGSQGHETAGFQVDTGCTNGVIQNCTSGGRDGERIANGSRYHWPNFQSVSHREEHYHVYPYSDGEGTAGAPITLSTDAADETNGPATTQDYFGEPKVIVAPTDINVLWSWFGVNLFAVDTNMIMAIRMHRIDYNSLANKSGGNAWDEGETQLTVDNPTDYIVGDLVWITSTYKTDGEIQRVTDVTGSVVTVEREASQFGAANTGLRWDHTTNAAGTEKMYRCQRESFLGQHTSDLQVSFGSARDADIIYFPRFREFRKNDGLLARTINQTDNTNDENVDITIVYREGGE